MSGLVENNMFTELPNVDRILQVTVFSNSRVATQMPVVKYYWCLVKCMSALLVHKSVTVVMVSNIVLGYLTRIFSTIVYDNTPNVDWVFQVMSVLIFEACQTLQHKNHLWCSMASISSEIHVSLCSVVLVELSWILNTASPCRILPASFKLPEGKEKWSDYVSQFRPTDTGRKEEKIYDTEAARIRTVTHAIFSYFTVLLLVQPIRWLTVFKTMFYKYIVMHTASVLAIKLFLGGWGIL